MNEDDGPKKRKRITAACDSCNMRRSKCDGMHPCRPCIESNITCEFNRIRKKRGKAARRDSTNDGDRQSGYNQTPIGTPVTHDDRVRLPSLNPDRTPFSAHSPKPGENWTSAFPSPRQADYSSLSHGGNHPGFLPQNHSIFASASRNTFIAPMTGPSFQMPPIPASHHLPLPGVRPLSASGDLQTLNSLFGGPDLHSPRSNPSLGPRSPSSIPRSAVKELRYPVLNRHINEISFIPAQVLCDLLDTYFDNSPYVLGYVLQRASVLHATKPRKTSTALIYAMLCVAAHTSEHPFLTATPTTRSKTVQSLFELSVTALRPLQHDEIGGGGLDDVITYMQLGTIIAASEFKGVSLRWLHAAWTLAKELKLNKEISHRDPSVTELAREERRRTWWLLYIMDRHLCLCYNKPLVLTDAECAELYHPINEDVWQSEQDLDIRIAMSGSESTTAGTPESTIYSQHLLYNGRARGPITEVQGTGPFGFFLPLMTILGEICTIFSLKHHHQLLTFGDLQGPKEIIREHLYNYERTLGRWADTALLDTNQPPIFTYYAAQLMHTMHVLLCCKWDPIDMLNDDDGWISSEEFVQATTHAVSAAEAVQQILELDAELNYMPFFFGIYLLQGSFLLLLIVDKLEQDADDGVIAACESYIRAHEVCVVTLDTQYQRNFRLVMRRTLNTVRQRVRSTEDEKNKRRELLMLYRWAKDGRGLVI